MTKKELISLLQLIYNEIPECRCLDSYTTRDLIDPTCHRHAFLDEELISYIDIAISNEKIKGAVI